MTNRETPGSTVVADAMKEYEVKDSKGRKLTLRKPEILAQYRIIDVLGERSKNDVYVGMVMPWLWVKAIDGEAVIQPTSHRELEALIQRGGEEGLEAITNFLKEKFGDEKTPAEVAETLKK